LKINNSSEGVLRFVQTAARKVKSDMDAQEGDATVVLVCVVVSPELLCDWECVWAVLAQELGAALGPVVSFVSSAIFDSSALADAYSSKSYEVSGYGLGYEKWTSSCRRLLLRDVCDVAVVVAADGDSYAELRAFMLATNPDTPLIRLSPAALRLDQDDLDSIVTLIHSSQAGSGLSPREVHRLLMGRPPQHQLLSNALTASMLASSWRSQPSMNSVRTLSSITLTPATLNIRKLNLSNLLDALKVLFPLAKLHNAGVSNVLSGSQDSWQVPKLPPGAGDGYFDRVRQLATAKVMTKRQWAAGRKRFQARLVELLRSQPALAGLAGHVCSVRAVVCVAVGVQAGSGNHNNKVVRLEANSASIVLRCVASIAQTQPPPEEQEEIFVQGVLDDRQDPMRLRSLFALCEHYRLPRIRHLESTSVPFHQRLLIQFCKTSASLSASSHHSEVDSEPFLSSYFSDAFRKYLLHKELPSGWWFDGTSYVEANGNRSQLRPDIDEVVERYVEEENRKIDRYNELLAAIDD